MTKLQVLSAAAALAVLSVAAPALAQDEPSLSGTWMYTFGNEAPCALQLKADGRHGDITPAATCPEGLARLAHYRQVGSNLELMSPSGDVIGVLHKTETGFRGRQTEGGRKLEMTRS